MSGVACWCAVSAVVAASHVVLELLSATEAATGPYIQARAGGAAADGHTLYGCRQTQPLPLAWFTVAAQPTIQSTYAAIVCCTQRQVHD